MKMSLQLAIYIAGGLAIAAAVWFLLIAPQMARQANKETTADVKAAAAASTQQGTVKAVAVNARAEGKIVVHEERAAKVRPRIAASPDPYREFLVNVCDTELYKADPVCLSRDGGSGKGPDTR